MPANNKLQSFWQKLGHGEALGPLGGQENCP